MKKKLLLLSLLIVVMAAWIMNRKENTAKPAEFAVTINDQKVKKGNEFTVYITVDSSVQLKKINAYLEYNSEALEFVKADNSAVAGTDGTLCVNEEFETPVTSVKYAVTMRAIEVGTSEFTIHDLYLEDAMNSDIIECNQASSTITVIKNTEEESDAALSELVVFPGTLNPSFEPATTEYEVNVGADTTELIMSAVPVVEASVVNIDQPSSLKAGANDVTITVTAPSGNVKKYHITVYRAK